MKKRLVFLTIILGISLSGCSQKEANIEPTEEVIETETEEVAIETEAVNGTESTVVEDVGGSGEAYKIYSDALIVYADGTYDFTDSFIDGLMSYDFFDGCNEEEVRDYVKSNDTFKILLIDESPELIDGFINSVSMNGEINLKQLLGQNDTSNSNTSSNKGNNTNSNKGNSSSSIASTSNNNSSSDVPPEDTASSGDTINVGGLELPAGSVDNGDGTWTTPDGVTVDVSSFNESYEEPIPSEPEPSEPVQSEPTHVAEDNGYSVGSTKTVYYRGRDITLTYQGNDVWIDNEGTTWHTYMNSDGHMHWSTGIY